MATASISLVREQTERVRPPRALWVPYALGRPLGSAEDPEFQRNVIRAALAMLHAATEPTIEDYPVEAPAEAGPEEWACPISLAPASGAATDGHTGRLLAEVARLRPWSAETRAARGRTLFGASGAAPDQVKEVAQALGQVADTGDLDYPPPGAVAWAFAMPLLIRHLADDLRTFYHEAIAAQPGPGAPNHDALNRWIFGGTALGEALTTIADHLTAATDRPAATRVRGLLIPQGYYRS